MNPCHICGRPANENGFCSEFCNDMGAEEKIAFLKMKEGDFGFWPCSRCGCTIEDAYTPGGICGGCGPAHRLENLLREALPHLPPDLAVKVRKHFEDHRISIDV